MLHSKRKRGEKEKGKKEEGKEGEEERGGGEVSWTHMSCSEKRRPAGEKGTSSSGWFLFSLSTSACIESSSVTLYIHTHTHTMLITHTLSNNKANFGNTLYCLLYNMNK